jgi:hypothetical protein
MQQWTSDTQIDIGKSIRLSLNKFFVIFKTYFVDFPVRVMLLPSLGIFVAARVSTDVGVPAIAEFPIYFSRRYFCCCPRYCCWHHSYCYHYYWLSSCCWRHIGL